jgi:hypothetical protein
LGGPNGRVGRPAAGPIGPEARKKSFQNKNWIFEFTKALEICTRRFRWNFGTRIFSQILLGSSWILEKYNMSCHECNLRPNEIEKIFFLGYILRNAI